jgi:P-type conjugative transfer protein TrbJ
MRIQILAAKISAILIMVFCEITSVYAGIPVIDGANVAQDTITAGEQVAQTLKQIQQYTTQLNQYSTQINQYSNMLQNTLQLPSFQWDAASSTITSLLGTVNNIQNLQTKFGSLGNYLSSFQSIGGYAANPCFTSAGCTPAQWLQLAQSRLNASHGEQQAYSTAMQGLAQQQTLMQNDAATLATLQSSAQNANGQVQAITAANQIASSQANQLLQIRGLLIAEQNAIVARNQAEANKAAQEAAVAADIRTGKFVASPAVSW